LSAQPKASSHTTLPRWTTATAIEGASCLASF
jgi:hypothetical protein